MHETVSQKKQRIKNSAVDMFAKKGNVTIRELSRATGVNIASINYYFGGKENLLAEIELAMVNRLRSIIKKLKEMDLDPVISARSFIEEAYTFFSENPGFFKFIGGTLINQNHPYMMKYLKEEISHGILKQYLYSLIEKGANITDKTEIENRCMIFFASLALPLFQIQFTERADFFNLFKKVIRKENFISYMNSLMSMLMRA